MMLTSPAQQVLSVLQMARQGRFDEVRDLFAEPLRPMVSAAAPQGAWDAELARLGAVCSVGAPVSEAGPGGVTVVKVAVTCQRGAMALVASVTALGQLTGIQLAPPSAAGPVAPWVPPGYVDVSRFEEEEVELGPLPLAVPGTLAIPKEPRPCAAVVVLAGSGPNDRDGTVARSKPLKDLAWGLASGGIAVLRFDKVTFAHPAEMRADEGFTVADEYLTHASAAVRLLSEHPAVDRRRIFVLGHSLGGTVAPRLAAEEPSLAGLIILAGGNEPLHWAAVRQVRYLASLNPATATAAGPVVEARSEQARRVDSPELSSSTPSSELPFGTPASYWVDLRSYRPVQALAALSKPVFILQGGRDYQVTVEGDLAAWQAGLADRADVTVRVYPSDNHFFFSGTGPSTPLEYEPAQHVDPAVVSDIVDWLGAVAAGRR